MLPFPNLRPAVDPPAPEAPPTGFPVERWSLRVDFDVVLDVWRWSLDSWTEYSHRRSLLRQPATTTLGASTDRFFADELATALESFAQQLEHAVSGEGF